MSIYSICNSLLIIIILFILSFIIIDLIAINDAMNKIIYCQ